MSIPRGEADALYPLVGAAVECASGWGWNREQWVAYCTGLWHSWRTAGTGDGELRAEFSKLARAAKVDQGPTSRHEHLARAILNGSARSADAEELARLVLREEGAREAGKPEPR
jgi:hypothetical protein